MNCRWWVYIIDKNDHCYVGITTDPPNRLRQHGNPASRYLEGPMPEQDAVRKERKLKKLSLAEKRDLLKESSPQ
jgi:predicted GIY-YIG superfamily endonuclease